MTMLIVEQPPLHRIAGRRFLKVIQFHARRIGYIFCLDLFNLHKWNIFLPSFQLFHVASWLCGARPSDPFSLKINFLQIINTLKLDGVGPVDNRPFTDNLQH